MKVEILAKKTNRDPSSYKSWKVTDELFDGYVENEEVTEKFSDDAKTYYKKLIRKIQKLVEDHNDVIRQIGSVRKNQKLVAELRKSSDKLEAELVMTVEITNEFLDKIEKDQIKKKKKTA